MCKSIYDCMAYIIRNVIDNTDKKFYQIYPAIKSEKSEELNELIQGWFPEILQGNCVVSISSPFFLEEDFVNRIRDFVSLCLTEKNLMALVRLISKMDSGLAQTVRNSRCNYDEMNGLNSNWQEQQIQLLPRCKSSWEHENRERVSSCKLDNFMNHTFYIDLRELQKETECTVSHRMLNVDDFQRAINKRCLHIGIAPMSDQTRLEIVKEETEEKYCEFRVTGLSNVSELKENALALLERAKEEEVDILCFPEMLGHPEIQQALAEKLQEFSEDSGRYPVLTALPSYWENAKNTTIVLNGMGEEICAQSKQFRYPYKEDGQVYVEGIVPNYHIQILHCDGIGRIGIMICKDALMRNYLHNVLDILKITFLIVPSFSTGYYDFETTLKTCDSFDCNAVWINSCSAKMLTHKKQLEVVGFVMKHGRKTRYKNGIYHLETENCKKQKGGSCKECLFMQKMNFDIKTY